MRKTFQTKNKYITIRPRFPHISTGNNKPFDGCICYGAYFGTNFELLIIGKTKVYTFILLGFGVSVDITSECEA